MSCGFYSIFKHMTCAMLHNSLSIFENIGSSWNSLAHSVNAIYNFDWLL